MPYDYFLSCVQSMHRVEKEERVRYVVDTANAASGALGGKGLEEYIKHLSGS